MSQHRSYRICGVNEHFNFPWRYGIEQGYFERAGIHLVWTESKGGTGEMTRMLADGSTDLAVLLTEGLITDIFKNDTARLLQMHVKSPLHWGIHVHKDSTMNSPADIHGKRYAISRYGSGSHLMALVHARENGKDPEELSFEVVNSLEGGLTAVQNKNCDVFLWEKYTTAPFLQSHELKYIGDVVTPWPSFALAASKSCCMGHSADLKIICQVITDVIRHLLASSATIELIAERQHLSQDAVRQWYLEMEWNTQTGIRKEEVDKILHGLCKAGLLNEEQSHQSEKFLHSF